MNFSARENHDRSKDRMNSEMITLLFQRFGNLLEDRFSKQVYTTEDSIRYTLFYCLTRKMQIHPSDIIQEYPHTHIPGAKIDTYIPPMEKRPGLIFEFKFNRKMPAGARARFLNAERGEFTQKAMGEALGVSQPIVSRRLKILIELGLVVVARTEGVEKTGGRRTLYRRA